MIRNLKTVFHQTRPVARLTFAVVLGMAAASIASAQPYIRQLYSNEAGAVSEVAITKLKLNWAVTAVRNGAGYLELISWYNDYLGNKLTRKGSHSAGPISKIAVADLDADRVVTAAINGAGNLEVVSWKVDSTGNFSKQGTGFGDTVTSVDITRLDGTRLVTACGNAEGKLELRVWKVDTSGNITAQGSATGSDASKIAVVARTASQVVTALRNAAGNLQVSSWAVDAGGAIAAQHSVTAHAVSQVDAAPWSSDIVTAVKNVNGKLELIQWGLDASGNLTRKATGYAGLDVGRLAVCQMEGHTLPFTAAVDGSGKLNVEVWMYSGSSLGSISATANAVNQVATAPVASNFTVTAIRNTAGNLEVTAWLFGVIG